MDGLIVMATLLTARARRERFHRHLHVDVVPLEKSQFPALRAFLQRVDSRSHRFRVLPHLEGLVRNHHAHLLHATVRIRSTISIFHDFSYSNYSFFNVSNVSMKG